jgi:hypothetical protein
LTAPIPPSNASVASDSGASTTSSPSVDSRVDPTLVSKSFDPKSSLRIPISRVSMKVEVRRSQSLATKEELEVIFRSLEQKKRSALTKSRKSPRVHTGLPMPLKRTTPLVSYTGEVGSLISVGKQSTGESFGDERDWFSD